MTVIGHPTLSKEQLPTIKHQLRKKIFLANGYI